MASYRVLWSIGVDANSPEEAAEKALLIQRNKDFSPFYQVEQYEGSEVLDAYLVDVNAEGGFDKFVI